MAPDTPPLLPTYGVDDVRRQRGGDPGMLERMDDERWADANTPFGKAVRHNLTNMQHTMLWLVDATTDGLIARRREAELRMILLGPEGARERGIEQGALGRLEDKVDAMTRWVKWGVGLTLTVISVAVTVAVALHH